MTNHTSTEAAALAEAFRKLGWGGFDRRNKYACCLYCGFPPWDGHGVGCRFISLLTDYDASLRAHANAASHSASEPEVSWLIEALIGWGTGNYWIGADGYRHIISFGTIDKAVRFSRKEDAERVIRGDFRLQEAIAGGMKIEATEHMWLKVPSEQPADTGVGAVAGTYVADLHLSILQDNIGRAEDIAYDCDHLWDGTELADKPEQTRRFDARVLGIKSVAETIAYSLKALAAPPAIPHAAGSPADQDKARNARSVGAGAVTDADVERACMAYEDRVVDGETFYIPIRHRMRAALESFAAHHAAEGARPQASGETGDALDAARYRWLREGDNDDACLRHLPNDRGTHWLLRREQLDAAIDAACSQSLNDNQEPK